MLCETSIRFCKMAEKWTPATRSLPLGVSYQSPKGCELSPLEAYFLTTNKGLDAVSVTMVAVNTN